MGGAKPEGVSNRSDICCPERGRKRHGNVSSTIGTKHAGAGSGVNPKVNSSTRVSDGTDVEGGKSCQGNICGATCSRAEEIPRTEVPCTNPNMWKGNTGVQCLQTWGFSGKQLMGL